MRTRITRLMYIVLFVLSAGGYLGSAWSGYPVKLFGATLPSWSANQPLLKDLASTVHLIASWTLAVAFVLHVAGTAKHALVDRNGMLGRMWLPRRRAQRAARAKPAVTA